MAILTISDFENGRYIIPTQGQTAVDLGIYIDRIEFEYLPLLFGKDLYDLFIADLAAPTAGEPTEARFVEVYNPFTKQPSDCVLAQSTGIVDMLKGLVYYHFIKDDTSRVTSVGIKLTTGDNSNNVTAIHHDILCRFNDSICTYQAIQWWMRDEDQANYPEFEGIPKSFNHPF